MISKSTGRTAFLIIILLLHAPFYVGAEKPSIYPMPFLNSKEVLEYCLELEALTLNSSLSSFSYRSAGSPGAQASAEWIACKLESFGLEVKFENFSFLAWELYDEPSLTLYVDSQPVRLETFIPMHMSWPTPGEGLRGNIALYTWGEGAVQVNGSILVVGVDDLILNRRVKDFFESIRLSEPRAILYTYTNILNMWMPPILNSAEGSMFWDIRAPAGWIQYRDWMKIKEALRRGEVQAEMNIPARISLDLHRNVIGRLPGVKGNGTLIVAAHYDTVMSPGFIDDASGVAGVLAIAHAFAEANRRGYTPPYEMRFVFFTAEEFGLIGSLHYRAYHEAELSRIIGVVNLDSIGGHRLKITESSSLLDEIAAEVAHELALPLTSGTRPGFKQYTDMDSEHAPESLNLRGSQCHETGADHLTFEDPRAALQIAQNRWGDFQLSIDEDTIIPAVTITSRPIFPYYIRTGEELGWIHTLFDNSTTPGWIDEERLKSHVEAATLTILEALQNSSEDLNPPVLNSSIREVDVSIGNPMTGKGILKAELKRSDRGFNLAQTVKLAIILISIGAMIILLPKKRIIRRPANIFK
ncbi:MAG: M28 family metallopeptidase [Candidatus Bathyarchaeia archaeon]